MLSFETPKNIEIVDMQETSNPTRDAILKKLKTYEINCLEIGKLLYDIRKDRLFEKWGYPTFGDYTKNELGFYYSKAHAYCSIWDTFGNKLKISKDRLADIGWIKLGHLAKLANSGHLTSETVDEWLVTAKNNTIKVLLERIQDTQCADKSENIPVISKPKSLETSTFVDTIHRLTFGLYPEQHSNVQHALDVAKKLSGSEKEGHLLDLICTAFLAGSGKDCKDKNHALSWFLSKIQEIYGTKVIAFNNKTDLKKALEEALKEE